MATVTITKQGTFSISFYEFVVVCRARLSTQKVVYRTRLQTEGGKISSISRTPRDTDPSLKRQITGQRKLRVAGAGTS